MTIGRRQFLAACRCGDLRAGARCGCSRFSGAARPPGRRVSAWWRHAWSRNAAPAHRSSGPKTAAFFVITSIIAHGLAENGHLAKPCEGEW